MRTKSRADIPQVTWNLCGAFAAALVLLPMVPVDAQVYRWTTEDGQTIYSSTPQSGEQQPAELPGVGRESISKKIETIKGETPPNCDSHGGIQCGSGKDPQDSSVICLDGFRDAILAFDQECTKVKLQAVVSVEFADPSESRKFDQVFDGDRIVEKSAPERFVVSVRNLSGVAAENVAVKFNIPLIERQAQAPGPGTIPAFGSEEYVLELTELMQGKELYRLAKTKLRISCDNCLQVRVRK